MLFAYLGEGSPPELPHLPELDDPQLLRLFRFATVDGNWLDLLEGFTGGGEDAVPPFFVRAGGTSPRELRMIVPVDDGRTALFSCELWGRLPGGAAAPCPASEERALRPPPVPDVATESQALRGEWLRAVLGPMPAAALASLASVPATPSPFSPPHSPDRLAGPLADLAQSGSPRGVGGAPSPDFADQLAGAGGDGWWLLDLLVRTHLPAWLEAIGETAPAAALRVGEGIVTEAQLARGAETVAEACRLAAAAFATAVTETPA